MCGLVALQILLLERHKLRPWTVHAASRMHRRMHVYYDVTGMDGDMEGGWPYCVESARYTLIPIRWFTKTESRWGPNANSRIPLHSCPLSSDSLRNRWRLDLLLGDPDGPSPVARTVNPDVPSVLKGRKAR